MMPSWYVGLGGTKLDVIEGLFVCWVLGPITCPDEVLEDFIVYLFERVHHIVYASRVGVSSDMDKARQVRVRVFCNLCFVKFA